MPENPVNLQTESKSVNLPIWNEWFAGIDYMALHLSPVYYGLGVPRGDGSGVVLIPGFLGTDSYLWELNLWLKRIGYRPAMSGIGRNADCLDVLVSRLLKTVERVFEETGRPVHLIGHSLGGLLARAAAEELPAQTASVVTMGSPFRGVSSHRIVYQASEAMRKRLQAKGKGPDRPRCFSGSCNCVAMAALRRSLVYKTVRQTAIYSKCDGIVDWHNCINEDPATNFEVTGTHIGLVFNPFVYRIIGNRLAKPGNNRVETRAAQRAQ